MNGRQALRLIFAGNSILKMVLHAGGTAQTGPTKKPSHYQLLELESVFTGSPPLSECGICSAEYTPVPGPGMEGGPPYTNPCGHSFCWGCCLRNHQEGVGNCGACGIPVPISLIVRNKPLTSLIEIYLEAKAGPGLDPAPLWQRMRQALRCTECDVQFKDGAKEQRPHIGRCGHCFCGRCVSTPVVLNCPICRRRVWRPHGYAPKEDITTKEIARKSSALMDMFAPVAANIVTCMTCKKGTPSGACYFCTRCFEIAADKMDAGEFSKLCGGFVFNWQETLEKHAMCHVCAASHDHWGSKILIENKALNTMGFFRGVVKDLPPEQENTARLLLQIQPAFSLLKEKVRAGNTAEKSIACACVHLLEAFLAQIRLKYEKASQRIQSIHFYAPKTTAEPRSLSDFAADAGIQAAPPEDPQQIQFGDTTRCGFCGAPITHSKPNVCVECLFGRIRNASPRDYLEACGDSGHSGVHTPSQFGVDSP